MIRVIVDSELRAKLHNLSTPLQLCDENGNVLATVTPASNPDEWVKVEPEISEEEMEKRRNSKKWYTTKEVLEYLENLDV